MSAQFGIGGAGKRRATQLSVMKSDDCTLASARNPSVQQRASHITKPARPNKGCHRVFFLFSNRLGCLGSLLVSVVATVLLLLLLNLV